MLLSQNKQSYKGLLTKSIPRKPDTNHNEK